MPELLVVVLFVRTLRPDLFGRDVLSAQVLWARTLATPVLPTFEQRITGQTIVDVGRRAKYINLQLSNFNLIIHLRMSGDVYVQEGIDRPGKHDRLRLGLSGGRQLVFNDTRKFGRVWLV